MKVHPEASLTPSVTGIDRTVMPPPSQDPDFTPPVPQRRTLPNGLGVTVVEKRDLPIVSFGLLVSGGTTTDPQGQPGLASLTAQMLSEGTETRTSQEIAEEFEFIGARLHSDTRRGNGHLLHRDPDQALDRCPGTAGRRRAASHLPGPRMGAGAAGAHHRPAAGQG